MHSPAERLHLPVLHPADPRYRDRFGLGPPSQNDLRVGRAPTHSGRTKYHDGIRDLELHAVARGSGKTPPRLPARGGKAVDADAVRGERHSRANRLKYRAVPS